MNIDTMTEELFSVWESFLGTQGIYILVSMYEDDSFPDGFYGDTYREAVFCDMLENPSENPLVGSKKEWNTFTEAFSSLDPDDHGGYTVMKLAVDNSDIMEKFHTQ